MHICPRYTYKFCNSHACHFALFPVTKTTQLLKKYLTALCGCVFSKHLIFFPFSEIHMITFTCAERTTRHRFRGNPDKNVKLQAELDYTHRNAVSWIELRAHHFIFNCYEVIVFLVASIHRTLVLWW